MKVWTVSRRYGDEEISLHHIFDSEEKARDYIKNDKETLGVLEMDEWVVE